MAKKSVDELEKKRVSIFFILFFPVIIAISLAILYVWNFSLFGFIAIELLLGFYQFVILKNFVDSRA